MADRYYLVRDLDSGEPRLLYRVFDDEQRNPEAASFARPTWQVTQTIWGRLAGGEIDDSDLIPEAEADAILRRWANLT